MLQQRCCSCLVFFLAVQLRFDDGEVMTWNKVTSTINNLILGKIYLEHSGTMRVQSTLHKKEMQFKFKDSGSVFGGSKRIVSGSMYEQGKEIPGYRYDCLVHSGCSVVCLLDQATRCIANYFLRLVSLCSFIMQAQWCLERAHCE